MLPPTPPAFHGPLPVKFQTGISNLAFLFEPERQEVLRTGERGDFVRLEIGNNSIYHGETSHYLFSDMEQDSLRLGTARGTAWGEWGVQATVTARTGGLFDDMVAWWHKNVVPFKDPLFSNRAHQQVDLLVVDDTNQVVDSGGALALTSVALTAKRSLRSGLSARTLLKLPVGGKRHYQDNGAVDLGLGLLGELHPGRRWALHGNANLVRAGTTAVGGLQGGHRYLFHTVLALEHAVAPRTSLVIQGEDAQFPFNRAMPHQGDRLRQMSIGVWHQAAAATTWHFSFSENIYPFQVTSYTADFQLAVGLVRRR